MLSEGGDLGYKLLELNAALLFNMSSSGILIRGSSHPSAFKEKGVYHVDMFTGRLRGCYRRHWFNGWAVIASVSWLMGKGQRKRAQGLDRCYRL